MDKHIREMHVPHCGNGQQWNKAIQASHKCGASGVLAHFSLFHSFECSVSIRHPLAQIVPHFVTYLSCWHWQPWVRKPTSSGKPHESQGLLTFPFPHRLWPQLLTPGFPPLAGSVPAAHWPEEDEGWRGCQRELLPLHTWLWSQQSQSFPVKHCCFSAAQHFWIHFKYSNSQANTFIDIVLSLDWARGKGANKKTKQGHCQDGFFSDGTNFWNNTFVKTACAQGRLVMYLLYFQLSLIATFFNRPCLQTARSLQMSHIA